MTDRKFDRLELHQTRKCGDIVVDVYGIKEGESYFLLTYYANSYKEAAETFHTLESSYLRG